MLMEAFDVERTCGGGATTPEQREETAACAQVGGDARCGRLSSGPGFRLPGTGGHVLRRFGVACALACMFVLCYLSFEGDSASLSPSRAVAFFGLPCFPSRRRKKVATPRTGAQTPDSESSPSTPALATPAPDVFSNVEDGGDVSHQGPSEEAGVTDVLRIRTITLRSFERSLLLYEPLLPELTHKLSEASSLLQLEHMLADSSFDWDAQHEAEEATWSIYDPERSSLLLDLSANPTFKEHARRITTKITRSFIADPKTLETLKQMMADPSFKKNADFVVAQAKEVVRKHMRVGIVSSAFIRQPSDGGDEAGALASSAPLNEMVQLVGSAVLLTLGQLLAHTEHLTDTVALFVNFVKSIGVEGSAVFATAVVFLQVVPIATAFLLTLASGAAFGNIHGIATLMTCSTLSDTISFLITRNFGRELVVDATKDSKSFKAIEKAFRAAGFGKALSLITLLRLSPVLPFAWANYVFGISAASALEDAFALGTFVGTFPGISAMVNAGETGAVFLLDDEGENDPFLLGVAMTGGISFSGNFAKKAMKDFSIDVEEEEAS
eukprot:TRINITY_DN64504_c0_g1_i1.p1 TRINITY_DN64504_c0_g1~~TRINITY_DN64504_c0_g1_i1.p1  ORF type:complete len:554 (+),score=111.29 TRINITY_DN64504_c0_g1_i1:49-1710(+)